jgi:hypothetical protein
MIEALSSSETSDLTRTTRRNITEDAVLHYNFQPHIQIIAGCHLFIANFALLGGLYCRPQSLIVFRPVLVLSASLTTSLRSIILATPDVVPSSLILSALVMQAIRSSETSVLIRSARRHIPEDDIHHSHGRENLKSYIALTGWTP